MVKLNMVQAINRALDEEMARDESVITLGQDVGLNGGVFRVTDGLHAKYGEERVIDTPLAESGIIGSSIGMAIAGLRPVAEMQFSGFSYLMLGQLEGHASRLRSRTHGQHGVPLVVRMPYGAGVRALEHHSESHEATYAHIPGVKVVIPSGPSNARALLTAAIRDPDPVVFMEPKCSYRAFRENVPEEPQVMEIGKAQVVQEGTDLTVVSWGAMMRPTLKGVESAQKAHGMSIELIDLLTISPMDTDTIIESVKKTGRCVVVQEAPKSFSPASEIIATINDEALMYLEAPVKRITGFDVVTPFFNKEQAYLPNEKRVRHAIEETIGFQEQTVYEFILPDLGEGVHEGEVLKWHVQVGATINEDDPLVDIETDKAAITIPSPKAGTVTTCNGAVGDIVIVGNVIVVIDDGSGGEVSAPVLQEQQVAAAAGASSAAVAVATAPAAPAITSAPTSNGGPVIAAPATRRTARELNIDIKQVPATGPGGRVTPEDVQAFASGGASAAAPSAPAVDDDAPRASSVSTNASGIPLLDVEPLPDFSTQGPVETEPLRSIRRKVARKMVTSMIMVPHVAHMDEADVTLLDNLRRRQNEQDAGETGGKLSLLPFVIRAVTEGLKQYGMFNASLDAVNELITYKKYYNMGVAVDSGRGLIVPVIRDTDRKSVLTISTEIQDVAARARSNELAVDEMRSGTFTITNIGALGGTGMIPTINYPEVAILGMGKVQEKPVVVDGKIAIRKMLPLTLAFDHRIADGADAARFVTGIVRRLSNPDTLLIES